MKNSFIEKMENLEVPKVETLSHKHRLKKALLVAHEKMQPKPFIPNLLLSMKKIAPLSLAAVVLVAGALVGTNLLSSPIASAQSMIEKAIAQVQQSKMDPAQQEKVLAVLNKAKQAKDLKFEGEKSASEKGKVKKVSFSDSTGAKVVLDLDESNKEKPVAIEGEEEEQGSATIEGQKDEESSEGTTTESAEQEKASSETKAILPVASKSTESSATEGTKETVSSEDTEKTESITSSESASKDSLEVKKTSDSDGDNSVNTDRDQQ